MNNFNKGLVTSLVGLSLIATFEGLRHTAYVPVKGDRLTICAGHTDGVQPGQIATDAECQAFLKEDVKVAEGDVKRCTTVPIGQAQFDSLVAFTMNVGGSAYCKSTLVRKLNAGDCIGAANEFPKWVKSSGIVYPGLVKRRMAEKDLFLKGC